MRPNVEGGEKFQATSRKWATDLGQNSTYSSEDALRHSQNEGKKDEENLASLCLELFFNEEWNKHHLWLLWLEVYSGFNGNVHGKIVNCVPNLILSLSFQFQPQQRL